MHVTTQGKAAAEQSLPAHYAFVMLQRPDSMQQQQEAGDGQAHLCTQLQGSTVLLKRHSGQFVQVLKSKQVSQPRVLCGRGAGGLNWAAARHTVSLFGKQVSANT